jgi:hypothetical protein
MHRSQPAVDCVSPAPPERLNLKLTGRMGEGRGALCPLRAHSSGELLRGKLYGHLSEKCYRSA